MESVRDLLSNWEDATDAAGTLGRRLLDQIKAEAYEQAQSIYFSAEIDHAIRKLKQYEKESDLLWIDNYSWEAIPERVRRKLKSRIDIFEWHSAYLRYSDFKNCFDILTGISPSHSVYVLNLGTYYRVVVLGSLKDAARKISEKYFDSVKNAIHNGLLYSFGKLDGKLIFNQKAA